MGPINHEGSPQHPLTKAFGKLCELVSEGKLLVTAQAIFEQPRDDLTNPDTDTAEQHQQFAVCFVHCSTARTYMLPFFKVQGHDGSER